jgi:hypothetical protein
VVVVAEVVDWGGSLRGSVIWLQQWDMGGKENKATVSTAKYSASKDLHYLCNIIKKRLYMWTGLQNARIEGESLVLSKTSIFVSFIVLQQ